ncbi:MAG: 4Fe-4S dicluster domain-containing protein [Desulforhopalus sp.]|nr:4Fe-4S dicluster domain-containing protein [Desulforhopalus sp.]
MIDPREKGHSKRDTRKGTLNQKEQRYARKKLKELVINRDWCKGCGICVKFCPTKVLELDSKDKSTAVRPEDCICCGMCELRCPDLAIEVLIEEGGENE